jgi:lysophospholipase L1-like esterase
VSALPGIVLVAAVLLVAAELGSRWWIGRHTRYHVWPPGLRLEMRWTPAVFAQVESSVRFEVNSDGERGGEVRGDGAGLSRVLVAGGSPVECLALDQPTSWPGALERLLNSAEGLRILGARRVHVGSIGSGGIASRHLDLIFERVLPQYGRLALVVIMVGGNDVFQWLEEGAPPSLQASAVAAADIFSCHPEQAFGWKPAQWAMVELARRMRRTWLRPVKVWEQAGAWVPVARKMRAQATEQRLTTPDPTVMLDRFAYHFRRLLQRAQTHADRVLVVRQPWFGKEQYTSEEAACFWHGGTGKAWKQTINVYYALDVANHLMALMDARAAAVADELGIEHLDLRPLITPCLENYYDFVHYTPRGASVVARAVGAAVLRRLPRTGRAAFTLTDACATPSV